MADLTDEEKIVIGVCVGIGGLVLIAIVAVLCYYCLCRVEKAPKKRRRRHHYVKERIVDSYRPPPYEPIPIPYPPPMPAPIPLIKVPPPRPVTIDYTDPYKETDFRYGMWDGVFRNDPIVIPLEPEIISDGRYMQDPETIYLKYNDDQALLRTQNVQRRYNYAIEAPPQPIRRARSYTNLQNDVRNVRSFTVTKRETPYVGEWNRRPDKLGNFNENAYKSGRDPYLWN